MDYSYAELLIGGVIIFVAYLVRGITGFGSGLIAIPLLTLMFDLTQVVPLVVLLDLIGSGAQAINNRKHTDWNLLYPLVPVTLLGIGLAMYFFMSVDTSMLTMWLGVFVIFFAFYQLLPATALAGGPLIALPFGLLGGMLGTLFGTGGPFYVMYFSMRCAGKSEFRASYAVYFVLDGFVRMTVYILGLSFFSIDWIKYLLLAMIPFTIGLYAGGKVHHEIEPIVFKRLISAILLISGIGLIFNT